MRRLMLALALAVPACGPASPESEAPLLVAAASDLQEVMPALIVAFQEAEGGEVTATFGPSGRLAAQIEAGAPVDVFLSADEGFIRAVAGDLEEESIRPYATGRLALVGVRELEELRGEGVRKIAMANPEHAPYGKAAREALRGAGLWGEVEEKIVLAESVRQAQQFVESGNAEAGLVSYATARGSTGLGARPVDESLYPPLVQWMGVVKGTGRPGRARAFAEFMASERARRILEEAGFRPPPAGQEAERASQSAKEVGPRRDSPEGTISRPVSGEPK